MNDQNRYSTARESLEKASKIIILLPPEPADDLLTASVSLYLSLLESGKQVQIGCSSEIGSKPNILGTEHIKDTVGNRNLIISFDFPESDLDKVDYDIRPDGKFVLMIKPKAESPVPDASQVKFSYSGANADLVVVFGIHTLEELGKIYADEKSFLDSAKILSLNVSPRPASFSAESLHLFLPTYVELVSFLLEKSNLKTSPDAASNLINFIYTSTQNLTASRTNADIFSVISHLLRSGGRLPHQAQTSPRFATPSFFDAPQNQETPVEDAPDDTNIPSDWKKPKIFRANEFSPSH